jgi:predicted SAM-dependent methyltransferase
MLKVGIPPLFSNGDTIIANQSPEENAMPININLGCGDQQINDYIGLDLLSRAGVDVICDLEHPLPLANGVVDRVYAKSLLEHIDNLEALLKDVQRILKSNGMFQIYVPHWSNPFYYSDYSHVRFFGLATFDYFINTSKQTYRRVPVYTELQYEVNSVRLLFESPFSLLRRIMKVFQWAINQNVGLQTFYEFHISHLIPCYAIEFILKRTDTQSDD